MLEQAARELCHSRGQDPDAVHITLDALVGGQVYLRKWQIAALEVARFLEVRESLRKAESGNKR